MAGSDYIPSRELDQQAWLQNFATVCSTHVQELNLTQAQLAEISSNATTVTASITDATRAAAVAAGKIKTKKATLKNAIQSSRGFVAAFQANKNVTVELKDLLKISPRDTPRTHTPPTTPDDPKIKSAVDGTNTFTWKRGENKIKTNYIVEVMIGSATEFSYLATVTETRLKHRVLPLGTKVQYRVRAERNKEVSGWTVPVVAFPNGTMLSVQKAA